MLPEENEGKVRANAVTMAWRDSGIDHICIAGSGTVSEVSKRDRRNSMRS